LTGCPCRDVVSFNRKDLLQHFALEENKKTILILGGSQGSRRINQIFLETLPSLRKNIDFQVIHLCGEQDYPELEKKYQNLGVKFRLFSFLNEMDKAYGIADLAIARAGAV